MREEAGILLAGAIADMRASADEQLEGRKLRHCLPGRG
jgi:hypothetical protein